MALVRIGTAAAALALASMAVSDVALAQADVCTSLEAQLVALDRGATPGGTSNYRQIDASVARQQVELDNATAEARRAGCMGGFLIFQPRADPKCGALMGTINRMKANLQRLTAQRDRYSPDPYDIARQRETVLRQLADNQCGRGYQAAGMEPPPRPGNFFEMLFGGGQGRSFGDDGYYRQPGQFGTYRTLCVRTCDGYYFPISFSTVPGQFAADEQTCQSMCPGAEVSLFTYANPGEDINQMVSLTGQPYTALPNAFRYRKEYDKACTCRSAATASLTPSAAPTALTPIAGDTAAPLPAAILPVPVARTSPAEDPETTANTGGGFTPKPVAPPAAGATVAGVSSDGERKVRIVGPSYYYAQ